MDKARIARLEKAAPVTSTLPVWAEAIEAGYILRYADGTRVQSDICPPGVKVYGGGISPDDWTGVSNGQG